MLVCLMTGICLSTFIFMLNSPLDNLFLGQVVRNIPNYSFDKIIWNGCIYFLLRSQSVQQSIKYKCSTVSLLSPNSHSNRYSSLQLKLKYALCSLKYFLIIRANEHRANVPRVNVQLGRTDSIPFSNQYVFVVNSPKL